METGITPDFLSFYRETMQMEAVDASQYSPLVLAYVGDAVYELMVRVKAVNHGNLPMNKLIKALEGELTPEEHAVFKRGRNAKSMTSAKNASVIDYRYATGFEALVGWLFLSEQFERLTLLIRQGFDLLGEE